MSEENKYSKLLDKWNSSEEYRQKYDRQNIDACFQSHIAKIQSGEMKLNDYAGPYDGDINGCTYLTTFLETKSRKIYGSARPGNMFNNGIYFSNKDEYKDTQYFISEDIHGYQNIDKKTINATKKQNKQRIYFQKDVAEKYFEDQILPFLKDIVGSDKLENIKRIEIESERPMGSTQLLRKTIAMHNMGKFLYIYSNEMIDVLYKFFVTEDDEQLTNIEKNNSITKKLKELGFVVREDEDQADYIINLSHFIWDKFDSNIDLSSKNTILHGAPGTGKTYTTDKSIDNQLSLLNNQDINKQYKLIQFHPSFGYEEFIDGIKPVKPKQKNLKNGIQLELVNGIFKEMCIDAFKELIRFKNLSNEDKKGQLVKKFYFVADEINRAELSRVFGELLLCLEDDKRLGFDKNGKLVGTKIKTQNSSLWTKEHAVVIMKDNTLVEGENEDGDSYYFGVPENLYFIGTMNDIDRSVDSFDMALRRRFVWKHYSYTEKVVEEHYEKKFSEEKLKGLDEYLKKCKNLNTYIVGENGFNLPESYMLGHSYFMNLSSFSDPQLTKLWDEKIAPLLTEYLRVNFEGKKLDDKLKCTKKIFFGQELDKSCK